MALVAVVEGVFVSYSGRRLIMVQQGEKGDRAADLIVPEDAPAEIGVALSALKMGSPCKVRALVGVGKAGGFYAMVQGVAK